MVRVKDNKLLGNAIISGLAVATEMRGICFRQNNPIGKSNSRITLPQAKHRAHTDRFFLKAQKPRTTGDGLRLAAHAGNDKRIFAPTPLRNTTLPPRKPTAEAMVAGRLPDQDRLRKMTYWDFAPPPTTRSTSHELHQQLHAAQRKQRRCPKRGSSQVANLLWTIADEAALHHLLPAATNRRTRRRL